MTISPTPLSENEKILKLSLSDAGAIIENSLNEIFIFDAASLTFRFVNRGARTNLGYSQQELSTMTPVDIKPLMDDITFRKTIAPLLEGQTEKLVFETIHRRKDGTDYDVEVHLQRTHHAGKSALVAIILDVTERNATKRELEKHRNNLQDMVQEQTHALRTAKDKAERANALKNDFISNISHELRTPMHAIISFSRQGMTRFHTWPEEKIVGLFHHIHASGKRLSLLINELLDISKLESGQLSYAMQTHDLSLITRTAIAELSPLISEKNLRVKAQLNSEDNELICDHLRIHQTLVNLLSNAIKFSPAGSVIDVYHEPSAQRHRLTIRDRGIGIPPEETELIFEKFVQSSFTVTGSGGTGLGLSVCKQIVQDHGGRIWAENHPDGGALLVLDLPREPQPTESFTI